MTTQAVLYDGAVHPLPGDLQQALVRENLADLWNGLTLLARNEFICWVSDAKKKETRARRIRRTCEELHEGKRRPCCWPGCKHRERNANKE
ncbi:YdeI/OmpD-associated family protein [Corynebacterium pseudodiphtheriticum]|uniref:YdeI/OmpD-associated family protein n=1 Tax=Corynebacterium pseudodiphtheriticum TaxID=37637 RepID=UPI00254A1A7E|nr:YdeI/OmpD-associated family protein [Corynebacterium pseudodiphtheriticum]MDK8709184.1 YdeI/OmpD-associated family protein [Corynebacterium pseudodiphtheriticum]